MSTDQRDELTALDIVTEGRAHTVDHFGRRAPGTYVGRFPAHVFDDAVDELAADFMAAKATIERLTAELEQARAVSLLAAVRAAGDVADAYEALEQCLCDMVIATGALRGTDTLFKLLDARTRACELLDLDPAGHDWTLEP